MQKPKLPKKEAQRLETLRNLCVLDTPREERFDRLTRFVARAFGVPICLISLVDESRQWFKSSVGLDVPETPRDVSFCGHVILHDQVMVVPDAREDERFSDNPLTIGEPRVVFYAGVPLSVSNGSRIGTLCVIDHEPRRLSVEQVAQLKDMAALVEAELFAPDSATLDPLTGISSSTGFTRLTHNALFYSSKEAEPVSLTVAEVSDLGDYVECHGQQQADAAIKLFAEVLRAEGREIDLLGRLTENVFVALCIGVTTGAAEQKLSVLISDYETACGKTGISEPIKFEARVTTLYNDHVTNFRILLDGIVKASSF